MKPTLHTNLVSILALIFTMLGFAANGQSYIPDPFSEPASNGRYFYQNNGQLVDDTGNAHPEVLYYTPHSSPSLFFTNTAVAYSLYVVGDTSLGIADSTFRVDMHFACTDPERCGTIQTYEQSSDHLNFYLSHCPAGVTNVPGYAGIEYDDVFPFTDMHFYSNSVAFKNYIRFRPGANPNDFQLTFTGQDSISAISSNLDIYLGSHAISFPVASAYQVNGGGVLTPLSWVPTWYDAGSGLIKLNIGSFNPAQELIIKFGVPNSAAAGTNQILNWSTYYGGNGIDDQPVITTSGNKIDHAMSSSSTNFPKQGAKSVSLTAGSDIYISQFNTSGVRQWGTFYGGNYGEKPTAILTTNIATTNAGYLFVAGQTSSTTLPMGSTTIPAFQKTSNGNGSFGADGFIANFDDATGEFFYATYIGGSSTDIIYDLAADITDGIIYLYSAAKRPLQIHLAVVPLHLRQDSSRFSQARAPAIFKLRMQGQLTGFLAALKFRTFR